MYPLVLVPIFLLFFATLAYGWFYWQRAKNRDVTPDPKSESPAEQ